MCSDFFFSAENHRIRLFEPLQRSGVRVRVFFHTWASLRCPSADEALVRTLQPTAHVFEEPRREKIVYSYLRALQLVLQHTTWDTWAVGPASGVWNRTHARLFEEFVVLLRFDSGYFQPITQCNIRWDTLNVAWRDTKSQWDYLRTVSDHLFILPSRLAPAFMVALQASGEVYKSGAAHYVLIPMVDPLERAGLEAHWIASEWHSSTKTIVEDTEKRLEEARRTGTHNPEPGVFMGLERRCGVGVKCNLAKLASFDRPLYNASPLGSGLGTPR